MRILRKFGARTLAAALILTMSAVPAMGADVTGNWAMTVLTNAGSGSMSIILQQEGTELKGNISGDAGNAPVNGKVENEVVTFSHDLPEYGISASYSGKVENNTIKGTVDYGNGAASGTFSAERKE